MFRKRKGFTLIELLIVVAIIAILAAIAVPNFLEAQVRAKVNRVKSDHRSMATALEAYVVDWNMYPLYRNGSIDDPIHLVALSTPIAYITNSHLRDPFKLYPPGTNNRGSVPDPTIYLHYIYIPFHKQPGENDPGDCDDWPANVDNKFRRQAAFPRVLGHDIGYGPPSDACKFPGPLRWDLVGYGPDFSLQFDNSWGGNPQGTDAYMPYDPTNGTVSFGDIHRFGQ